MARGLHGRKSYEYWPKYLQKEIEREAEEHQREFELTKDMNIGYQGRGALICPICGYGFKPSQYSAYKNHVKYCKKKNGRLVSAEQERDNANVLYQAGIR